jgi:hypothetical protein
MSKAGKKILKGLREVRRAVNGDPDAIRGMRVTPSCGCVFCDLKVDLHEDDSGFHHVAQGERIECTRGK